MRTILLFSTSGTAERADGPDTEYMIDMTSLPPGRRGEARPGRVVRQHCEGISHSCFHCPILPQSLPLLPSAFSKELGTGRGRQIEPGSIFPRQAQDQDDGPAWTCVDLMPSYRSRLRSHLEHELHAASNARSPISTAALIHACQWLREDRGRWSKWFSLPIPDTIH